MRVSDYILDFFVAQGIKHVFLITGGAIAFAIDAFHRRKDIEYICANHEQAAAMMADAYSRLGPGLGVAMTTSGPGATNLITGICCSWFDSIPVLYITGQVNTYEQKGSSKVRQVGFQETDIVSIVKPITKYAVMLDAAEHIRYVLEKAVYIAQSGRPGPVLIDLPMNFQRAEINSRKLKGFTPPKEKGYQDTGIRLKQKIKKLLPLMEEAKRPVLLAGGGIRLSGAVKHMLELAKITKFPVVASWSGYDVFPRDNPYYIGGHGVYGERGANFAVQNSDLLITIGSRLDTRQTGGKAETYAREAKTVMVDIDKAELDKRRGLTPYLTIQTDVKEFLTTLFEELDSSKIPDVSKWLQQCQKWKKQYPIVQPEYYDGQDYVNPYVFIKTLSEELDRDAVIIPDDGGHLTWTMQSFEVKDGQRLFSAYGNSPMGYAFPAAIGASFALGKKPIICIDGDGSIQINIQEFQTMVYHKLPIKLFILNNHGYGISRQFQDLYLNSHYDATIEGMGFVLPDFRRIAEAYGIHTLYISNHTHMRVKIKEALRYKGSVLVEVLIKPDQKLIPKLEFGKPIEDLSPSLPADEFLQNMIVKPLKEIKVKEKSQINEIN